MTLGDFTKFANDNPMCYLATVEGDQPRVRGFALWYADETGFYFHSGNPKHVVAQLKENPKAEVCFFKPAEVQPGGTMMRVAGKIEFLNDVALNSRLLAERPWLMQMGVAGPDDPLLAVFRLFTGECHFWTLSNMQESESERVTF